MNTEIVKTTEVKITLTLEEYFLLKGLVQNCLTDDELPEMSNLRHKLFHILDWNGNPYETDK